MNERAGWGILGTGKIARIFATDLRASRSGRLVAVGSRDATRASTFAADHGALRAYGAYDQLLADPEVQFVYVATPHPTHLQLTTATAAAGKHVLCEKPMAVDAEGARRMVAAARSAGVFLMEAFAFRCHPQGRRLIELLGDGAIGEIRGVSAAFGYDAGPAPTNYLHRRDLAGGSILDVGCYTVALARQLAGVAAGRAFMDPIRLEGVGLMHAEHGVDLEAAAIASFESGFTAQLACSIRTNLDSTAQITGTKGFIRLPAPWLPGKFGGEPRILIQRGQEAPEEIAIGAERPLYAIEADTVVDRARAGHLEAPEMSWSDSIGNMATLDRWRHEIGLTFEGEDADLIATSGIGA
jgi:predicted dehydrogenase